MKLVAQLTKDELVRCMRQGLQTTMGMNVQYKMVTEIQLQEDGGALVTLEEGKFQDGSS